MQLRFVLIVLFILALAACATAQRSVPPAAQTLAEDQAKPMQSWSPMPSPMVPAGTRASEFQGIVGTSLKQYPRANFRQEQPALKVFIPDVEVPRPEKKGDETKALWAPVAADQFAAVDNPEPLSWAGVTTSFLSTDFDDNGTYNSGYRFIPPDSHGAAGPNHLVDVVNTSISFLQKDGTLDFRTGLASFFASLSPLTFTFDPKVLYDQYENRWIVITMEQTEVAAGDAADTSRMFVGVSDDSDPNGTWYLYEFDTVVNIGGNNHWADYPGFGVDEEAVYISANLFPFSSGSYGVRLWILEKGVGAGGFYDAGGSLSVSEYDPYAGGGIETTTQISHMYGVAPAGTGVFLVSYSGIYGGATEYVQVVRVDDPLATPVFTQAYISIGNIEQTTASALPDMPQSGSATNIESNDRRALDAIWRDNLLWFTATINPRTGPDTGQATAMWVKVDTSNLASLSLADLGTIGGEDIATGTYTTFPSIAVNAYEDVVVGFSASAPSIHAGAYFANRQAGDAASTMGSSVTVKSGVDWYVRTFGGPRNRWGDYSATVLDPVDGCFWVYNQWADTRGTPISSEQGRWGTAWARTCGTLPDTCDATLNITANTWTRFALPCDLLGQDTVAEVFDLLNPGDYDLTWGVYRRDAVNSVYVKLGVNDHMTVGEGYWVYTALATQVNLDGGTADINDLDLVGEPSTGRWNMPGHNQNTSVDWADVAVVDGGSVLGLGDYDAQMSPVMQKWNGSAYQAFNGVTPGAEGTLEPFDAFWVKVFETGISLRIPEGTPLAPSVTLASAFEAEKRSDNSSGKQARPEKLPSWHVRLVATSGDLQDPGNVLGQADTATAGIDHNDLEELPPQGGRYLTILFRGPLFDEVNWGYTTDFRAPTKKPGGVWPFVVRASAGVGEVTLNWEGEAATLRRAWLIDEENGQSIRVKPGESYTFTMNGGEHAFRFEIGH